ncbi:trans-sulfuration enzyme family protein [Verrucosispora sp. WMMD703]|uniref:trans-sulfuration enzyme family protein n=1 Tax=Verrucosispora sp. WMMD703 TaxID=3403463 RepID=UPI003B92FA42
MRFDTRLVHGGRRATPGTGDVVPPIHVSTTYERRAQDDLRYFYGRGENPTREQLEECLADLEGARFATVLSSGQAAAATVLAQLRPGQCVVSTDDVYSGTDALFELAARQGVRVRYADLTTPEGIDSGLDVPGVALVWVETPTNPLLSVVDIAEVAGRAHERGARLVVDNTFASPALQRPLDLGADVSLYSTTKSIAGHADVLGGALVYADEELHAAYRSYRTAAGNVPGALDCFLVRRGLHTLSLRVSRQVANAWALVERLRASPVVGRVHYPGLAEHPQHAVAKAQMTEPGSMVSFEYLGGPAARLLDRFALFSCGVSLGGVHSLVECPALMTHRPVPAEVRARRGIGDALIRLSAGIEDGRDLVEDVSRALADGI